MVVGVSVGGLKAGIVELVAGSSGYVTLTAHVLVMPQGGLLGWATWPSFTPWST